jgi:hypothetical protein
MERILCALLVATLPFGSVLAVIHQALLRTLDFPRPGVSAKLPTSRLEFPWQ